MPERRIASRAHQASWPLTGSSAQDSMPVFSGQGETPYRRYAARAASPRAPSAGRVEQISEMPEPTVRVRMKENARAGPLTLGLRARDRLG